MSKENMSHRRLKAITDKAETYYDEVMQFAEVRNISFEQAVKCFELAIGEEIISNLEFIGEEV